jgi:Mn2+/Fe2+ NRAMP family transporter
VLIFMIVIVNKARVMKEWTNSPLYNVVAWGAVVVMIGLTLALTGITVRQMLG